MSDATQQQPGNGGPRLGVFGGSFDPVHVGHLIIAEEVRARLALERVLFVPARISPFKLHHQPASPEDRLAMLRLAVAGNPHLGISCVDLERPGPSYTVDTLRLLKEQYGPTTELFFVLGADSLASFAAWYRPQEILRLAQLVAIRRPGAVLDVQALEADLPGIAARTQLLTTLELGVSSTDIRRRVAAGLPIRYQVPESVEAYIRAHGLYLAGETP